MGYNTQGFILVVRNQFNWLEIFPRPGRLQFLSNGERNLVGKYLNEAGVKFSKCIDNAVKLTGRGAWLFSLLRSSDRAQMLGPTF